MLRILTNDLDASAQEIADLYKRRWAIELFFRWVKQTLKITHFLGTSENAVRIQIAVALIAFLLLRLAQAAQKPSKARSPSPGSSAPTSCTADASTACSTPSQPPILNPNQLAAPMDLKPNRTAVAQGRP